MHKKVCIILLTTVLIMLIAGIITDNERIESNAGLEATEKSLYEIILAGNEICLYEIENNVKKLVKKAEISEIRKADGVLLRRGIKSENREEALMIFEDFIS